MKAFADLPALLRTRSAIGYLAGLGGVALMTALIGLLLSYYGGGNLSMLYLIVVLAVAVKFGRGPAILASVAAFFASNWFFTQPLHTLTVTDPAEWIALILFLFTAVITGQVAAGERQRAMEAEQREREAVILYDVVRLMSEPDPEQALHAVAERLRHELKLSAVSIDVSDGPMATVRATVGEEDALDLISRRTDADIQFLSRGPSPTGARRGAPGRWIRVVPPHSLGARGIAVNGRLQAVPVSVQGRRVGKLLIVRPRGEADFAPADDRLLSTVAAQLGVAIDRVRLQREVTDTEILRRADELKTALLNAVSHDLRTPLASIMASAGSLRECDVTWTDEERHDFAKAIEEEATRLNRIVGNLLDLSRIEGGNLRPEKGWYDLGALVDDVLGRLRPLTVQHRVAVDIPDELPPILLDYVEIDQVLANLIENATKYADKGTEIRVSAHRNGAEVEVEVADRGPGIPPSALPHLFEPFYRAAEQGFRTRGTGLGLAVAKGLVEAHGGRIRAENRPEGGARLVFTLPLAEPSGAAKEPAA